LGNARVSSAKDEGSGGDIWLMLPGGSEHALRSDVTIGRGEDNDLILKTTTVGREHARVMRAASLDVDLGPRCAGRRAPVLGAPVALAAAAKRLHSASLGSKPHLF
jgi:hypothetical protein